MRAKCHLQADVDAKLERAVNRTLTTLPMLRIEGECVLCSRKIHAAHCPIGRVITDLVPFVNTFAPRIYPTKAAMRMRRLREQRKTA